MSKPYIHAQSSAKKFGGQPEEYMKFHEWFDQTKASMADVRHRAILHTSFGIYLCQQVFGFTFTNSEGKVISVRDIGEQHVLEDFKGKFIPSIQDYLGEMELKPWMNNGAGVPPSYVKIVKEHKKPQDMVIDGKRPATLPDGRPLMSPGVTTTVMDGSSVTYDGKKPVIKIDPEMLRKLRD